MHCKIKCLFCCTTYRLYTPLPRAVTPRIDSATRYRTQAHTHTNTRKTIASGSKKRQKHQKAKQKTNKLLLLFFLPLNLIFSVASESFVERWQDRRFSDNQVRLKPARRRAFSINRAANERLHQAPETLLPPAAPRGTNHDQISRARPWFQGLTFCACV